MTNRAGFWPATTVSLAALFLGLSLVRVCADRQVEKQRAIASEYAADASYRIEQQLNRLLHEVESTSVELHASPLGEEAAIRRLLPSLKPSTGALSFISSNVSNPTLQLGSGDRIELKTSEWTKAPVTETQGNKSELMPLIRQSGGDWIAVVRRPVLLTTQSANKSAVGWIVSLTKLADILSSSGVDGIRNAGFHWELSLRRPENPHGLAIAGSPETGVKDPVKRSIRMADGEWLLLLAPEVGWISWPTILSQIILVLVFTLAGALWTYDFARRPEQFRAEMEARGQRLDAVHLRLSEEIQQREELEKQFSRASFHDVLTGLPNRSHLVERLGRALQRARLRPGYVLAVIILNFDRFKIVNESLGTGIADELLIQAVQRFQNCLRPEDWMVARLGGDEFAMLLFDVGSAEAAGVVAKRLQDTLLEPFNIQKQNVFVTASMGIALSSTGYEDPEELLRGANIALTKAKADGRAQHAIFDPATREQIVTRHQLETDLHQAIERQEFCLNFQPIVSFETGSISGMETLIRWRHPLEGMVPPARFIPLAEETGLVVPITRWVLREACQQAATWRKRFPKDIDFYLSVNLSAQDLRQPDICDYITTVLRETGLPPGVLRLEVTESMMIGNINAVSELISRFREMEIPLLLDDFGTGYSSLSYLNRFRFDYIKIDQAFVRRSNAASENTGIVRAIVHLAHDMGSKTIAEGVETVQNVERLQALGCDYGQGYYFSKPLNSELAEKLLLSRMVWHRSISQQEAKDSSDIAYESIFEQQHV